MPSLDGWNRDLEQRPARSVPKAALIGTAVVLACIALVGLATTGSVLFRGESAKLLNPAREKAIVFDANRTLSTYEGFYDTCNSYNAVVLQSADATAEAVAREKTYSAEADPFGTERKSISAVRENARALRNQSRDIAASYNADSAKNTRAPFKAGDLPYTLDATGREAADCGTPKEAGR